MNEVPGPSSTQTTPPSEANLEAFKQLFPGVIQDGALDAVRLGELLDTPVSGVKEGKERFGLMWAGKKRAVEALQTPSMAALVPDKEASINWDTAENVFIEGDNLEVLKLLQKAYNDQVKLIYIDPPYNTGNDFVYNDDFSDPLQHYLEVTGQVDADGNRLAANLETSGRKHSNWLTMMYPRLVLARNLLTQDGVLALSIDDNEYANVRALLVSIFGEENLLATLIWNKQHSQQQGVFKRYHEYLILVARDASQISNISGGDGFIEAGALKKVSRANPASEFTFPAGTRFDAPDGSRYEGVFGDSEKVEVVRGVLEAQNGVLTQEVTLKAGWTQKNQMTTWFAGSETIDTKGQKVVEFYFNSAGKLKCRKERSSITPATILPLFGMVSESTKSLTELMGGFVFENPKPVELVKLLVTWFTKSTDLVMDFFAGSGTTAHAVMKANQEDSGSRKFLLVNIDEPVSGTTEAKNLGFDTVSSITIERIRRVAASLNDNKSGLRVFRIGESNFELPPEMRREHQLLTPNTLKPESGPETVAWQIALSLGQTLDCQVEDEVVSGSKYWSFDQVIVLTDLALSADSLSYALTKSNGTVVCLEDGFQGKDALKANFYYQARTANRRLKTF
jgi:adenine-specific DNA-methyltransferase